MTESLDILVASEVGRLKAVLLHEPGQEIANMTPETAERALYSDILNLTVAQEEYRQFSAVLEKRAQVFYLRQLLADVLGNSRVRDNLVHKICEAEGVNEVAHSILDQESTELAAMLIEGVPLVKDNLSRFLSRERYALPPLHNFFFTRDSAVTVRDKILISRMANRVRGRETRIVEAIFDHHPLFLAHTVNPARLGAGGPEITIEGGDILVASADILIIGVGARTTKKAVDFLIERIKGLGYKQHILVQILPTSPESFIHLDMVFTFLDKQCCMVYEPVILDSHHFDTVHIEINAGQVVSISHEDNLITALAKLGMEVNTISCGGPSDRWVQEREQWHSGANFFAMQPGQVIGYGRNQSTIEELVRVGFEQVNAEDVIDGTVDLDQMQRCVVTIDGSELARGGGGCRCMSMPLAREAVED